MARAVGNATTASAAIASSIADSGTGWLVRLDLEHRTDWFEMHLRARRQSADFRLLSDAPDQDRVVERVLATIGVHVNENNALTLAVFNQTTSADRQSNLVALSQEVALAHKGTVTMTAGYSINDADAANVSVAYSLPITF
jgi:hypothetical protein